MAASPRTTGAGAQIVDDGVFWLLLDMEIQKAQRLRYLFSVICVHIEAETGIPDVGATARMLASTIRSTDAVTARDGSTVALLLIDADASSLPTILQRLEVAALEAVTWSAGGACYPQTAASAEELLSQALAMMARARQDGGGRLYIPTTTS
jgi:hypothetical protein